MLIKKGDSGSKVVALQQALIREGFLQSGQDDGSFGPTTEKAVLAFQRSKDLFVDGVVGKTTGKLLGLVEHEIKPSWAMTNSGLEKAAAELGCRKNFMSAIAEVESSGGGFYKNGVVKVLFERHIFNRYLRKAGLVDLADSLNKSHPDLCNPSPGGYVGGQVENERLDVASQFHGDIAKMSASYGRFQIMGFHYERCGFNTVSEFVSQHLVDEDHQLSVFVKFIKGDRRLHTAVIEEDCATFATLYNGKHHKGYDIKIRDALARFDALDD